MTYPPRRIRPRGHTLLEMMLSLVLLSVVMASIGSAVMFASSAIPNDDSPTATLARDIAVIGHLAEDLAAAKYIIEQSATAVTVVVGDRTGDGIPDRLRYAWSGTSGEPLYVQINDQPPTIVLDSVSIFALRYEMRSSTTSLPGALQRSGSEKLLSNEGALLPNSTGLGTATAMGQRFTPSLSTEALAYEPTRVEFYGNQAGTANGVIPLTIRDISGFAPAGKTYASGTGLETGFSILAGWTSIAFSSASWVPKDQQKMIVLGAGAGSGNRAMIYYKSTSTPLSISYDSGGSWAAGSSGALLYRLYGYEIVRGRSWDITRQHNTAINLTLQSTGNDRSPVSRLVQMSIAPKVLDCFAETDFDVSPTTMDLDADGRADWRYASGSIPSSSLSGGVWKSANDLSYYDEAILDAKVISVYARMRSNDKLGPTIYGPYTFKDNEDVMPIATQLRSDGAGGQELVIYNDMDMAVELTRVDDLPAGLLDIQLVLLPQEQVLAIKINNEWAGAVKLQKVTNPGTITPGVRFGSSGGIAEFGRVSVNAGGVPSQSAEEDGGLISDVFDLLF